MHSQRRNSLGLDLQCRRSNAVKRLGRLSRIKRKLLARPKLVSNKQSLNFRMVIFSLVWFLCRSGWARDIAKGDIHIAWTNGRYYVDQRARVFCLLSDWSLASIGRRWVATESPSVVRTARGRCIADH
jgi:hypothetical protein